MVDKGSAMKMSNSAADYRHLEKSVRSRNGLSIPKLPFQRQGDFFLQFGQIKTL
jgi:thymidine kinase